MRYLALGLLIAVLAVFSGVVFFSESAEARGCGSYGGGYGGGHHYYDYSPGYHRGHSYHRDPYPYYRRHTYSHPPYYGGSSFHYGRGRHGSHWGFQVPGFSFHRY